MSDPAHPAFAATIGSPTPTPDDLDAAVRALPLDEFARRRIRMTAGCGECWSVPKVPGAGQVFTTPDGPYQLMHNGVKVVEGGYCGRWMTELIRLLHGHHEPQEERAFHELLRHVPPGATMVELGSHWAYYSLWFARAVPGARTILVEPDPGFLDVGRKNYALNSAHGEFHQSAVGRGSIPAGPFVCDSDGQVRAVPVVSVDDLLDRLAVARVDLLLADIQGAELAMLEGAQRAIAAGRVRFAVVSTHHHRISGDPLTHQKCLAFVRDHGGHVLAEHTVTESFSGDGLVVASFDPADRVLQSIELSRNRASDALFPETECDLADAWAALAVGGNGDALARVRATGFRAEVFRRSA